MMGNGLSDCSHMPTSVGPVTATFQKYIFLYLAICVASVLLIFAIVREVGPTLSFSYGIGVFSVNIAILVGFAARVLSANRKGGLSDEDSSSKKSAVSAFFSVGFLVLTCLKFLVLGALLYVGLIILNLSPWFLVGGAVASVAICSGVIYWAEVRTVES